jgi:2-dehydro-3-deoxyglucarate aldolase/4-hydroxy-2-oxoheptanedioate aldolase
MRTNPVIAALKSGNTVIGSEVTRLSTPEVPRIFALAGLDFAFIDMEHTPFGFETVADLVQASRGAGIVPIVRVPQAEYAYVARALDCGAQGLIVPRVNSPAQAREIVSWMRYPPRGIRGFANTFRQTDDKPVAIEDFIAAAHAETLCVIQIERREALDQLDEMLSIDGVDVACLGYMDLSVDLGVPGQLDHPRMVAAVERIISASARHNVAPGFIGPDIDSVLHWMSRGMRFVSYSGDGNLLAQAAKAAADRLRAVSSAKSSS